MHCAVLRIADPHARQLSVQALAALEVAPLTVAPGADLGLALTAADDPVLLDDLGPDPWREVQGLVELSRRLPRLGVMLLLPVRDSAIHAAVLLGARLPLVGVELCTRELTAAELSRRLRAVLSEDHAALHLWRVVDGWALPDPLRNVARMVLVAAPPDASLRQVLRSVGVEYECARRAAVRAGLPAPRTFAEALRVLRAIPELSRGRVADTALRHGFGKVDRFRTALRRHFGVTPGQAERIGAIELLSRLEAAWFVTGANPGTGRSGGAGDGVPVQARARG